MKASFKLTFAVALASSLMSMGCGSSTPTAQNSASNAANSSASNGSVASSTPLKSSAVDVVSQFLDAIRRGGDPSIAEEWLTTKAQQELARIGHKLEPIGSPDAKFTVTRAESLPESPGEALVHSYWEEPNAEGAPLQSQVVWAVVWERDTWKISGFAVQVDPNSAPVILDFENGDLMANYLNPQEIAAPASAESPTADTSTEAPTTASNAPGELSR